MGRRKEVAGRRETRAEVSSPERGVAGEASKRIKERRLEENIDGAEGEKLKKKEGSWVSGQEMQRRSTVGVNVQSYVKGSNDHHTADLSSSSSPREHYSL